LPGISLGMNWISTKASSRAIQTIRNSFFISPLF
jgi:hypothetical protein